MRRSIPRLIDGIHITDPDIDEMVERSIIKGHVIGATVKLVLVERHEAPMIHQVIHRQPLFQDVPEVLLWVL